MPRIGETEAGSKNALAWLDMIAWSEGTSTSKHTKDDGYDILVTGSPASAYPRSITDYSKGHPNILVTVSKKSGLKSTAFGRYQFLYSTWMEGVRKYGFRGRITPEAQDLMALKKTAERGALEDVHAGRFAEAIRKCNKEWASFHGSPYGQRTHSLATMLAEVHVRGGTVVA